MNKTYNITMINKLNGATVESTTNNLQERLKRLIYNVNSINGAGTAVFDRFKGFIGATENDIKFEINTI